MTSPNDPQERAYAFSRWANRAIRETMAARGWNKGQVTKAGGIGRTTAMRWLNGDISQGAPTIEKVTAFCRALNLDLEEPYRIMGWILDSDAKAPPASRAMPPEVLELLRYIDTLSPEGVQRVRTRVRFLMLEDQTLTGWVDKGQSTQDSGS